MNKSKIAHEIEGLEGKVLVDGFRLANERIIAYFLTHFHGDHYSGLTENFQGPGLIYCTKITARLVEAILGVKKEFVRAFDFGESVSVCGAQVTFLDANHCPGAALLLFTIPPKAGDPCGKEKVHLHTGDMRYSPKMKTYPALISARGRIDKIYLDTTYCHPKHSFPSQEDSISQIADSIVARLQDERAARISIEATDSNPRNQSPKTPPVCVTTADVDAESPLDHMEASPPSARPEAASHDAVVRHHCPSSKELDGKTVSLGGGIRDGPAASREAATAAQYEGGEDESQRAAGRGPRAEAAAQPEPGGRTLFLLSAYKIGKERVILEVRANTPGRTPVEEGGGSRTSPPWAPYGVRMGCLN